MKIVGFITSVLFSVLAFGQESYYFSNPVPSEQDVVLSVEKRLFGTYSSEVATRVYEVNQNGVTILTTSISSISRETIRESSKYDVRNNMLYGLIEKDSVPCVLEGENYYFGVQNRDVIIGKNSLNKLTRLSSNEYIINYEEDGLFVPAKLIFSGNSLTIKEMEYEYGTKLFKKIKIQKEIPNEYFKLIVLSPTTEEFEKLIKKGAFIGDQIFNKN
ncbi:MAG: hypothetical protein MK105_01940 [Crocinitomicaceae bacterium]|nr:hypothetical protein [Crocinitomicaceae bacterium]